MGIKTDDYMSQEIYESKEYNNPIEFGETALEVCDNITESNAPNLQIEKKKQRKAPGLLKRMGYLTAAALSTIVVTHSMVPTDALASSQNTQSVNQVRSKMIALEDAGYDEIRLANGGVIIVSKDGEITAVDHNFKEIIPSGYSMISTPSDLGYFVCASNLSENLTFDSTYLYNKQGKIVGSLGKNNYPGFLSTGNMAIVEREENGNVREYWNSEGKLVYKVSVNYYDEIGPMCGFYDRKMLLYRTLGASGDGEFGVMDEQGNILWQKSGSQAAGYDLTGINSSDTVKPKKKSFLEKLWHFVLYFEFEDDSAEEPIVNYPDNLYNPGYDDGGCFEGDYGYNDDYGCFEDETTYTWEEMNEMFGEGWEEWMIEDCYDDSYNKTPTPYNSFCNGYAFLRGYKNDEVLYVLMDENYNQKYQFYPNELYLTSDFKLTTNPGGLYTYDEIQAHVYLRNGAGYWNYGSKVVLTLNQADEEGYITGKNYSALLDLSLNGNLPLGEINPNILQAVHDEILISDEIWWLFVDQKNDEQSYGYMDHDGKVVKEYEMATEFTNGQALVVENGQTYMIDEKFNVIKSYGKTGYIWRVGELLCMLKDGKTYVVNL